MAGNEIEIPVDQRRAYGGKPVSAATVISVVRLKLANPLASRELIADTLGLHKATISEAMATPYARNELAVLADMGLALQEKVKATVCDSLTFTHDSVRRGVSELKRERPNSAAMASAGKSADLMLRNTILPDRMHVTTELRSADDYAELDEIDEDLRKLLDAPSD